MFEIDFFQLFAKMEKRPDMKGNLHLLGLFISSMENRIENMIRKWIRSSTT